MSRLQFSLGYNSLLRVKLKPISRQTIAVRNVFGKNMPALYSDSHLIFHNMLACVCTRQNRKYQCAVGVLFIWCVHGQYVLMG